MPLLKQDDDDYPDRQPEHRDRNQDETPREGPDLDPEPTQPVGDREPAVAPIKTMSDEATRSLRAPSPAERVERLTCKMCGKSFDSTQGLVDHEITVHPNVSDPPKSSNSEEKDNAA